MNYKMNKIRVFILVCLSLVVSSSKIYASSFTIEAETMTLSGPYAGTISSPFSGIALYANGDKGTTSHVFADGPGVYNLSIRGASDGSNAAGVSLYINNVKVKAFTFYGTTATVLEAEIKLSDLNQGPNTIELILETDDGSSDTFIDKITFSFLGPIVIKDPPVLPAEGAYYTGIYRNMLEEAGYTNQQINQRLDYLWNRLFYGDPETEAVYYPVGTDEAYMLDSGNNDVRSEGMSYGMMIAVQLDKQEEFDRLWKWVKTRMQFQTGPQKGYISWQINTDGSNRSSQCAPDGDEYIIMALMFASARWGDGEGIYNYWKEANDMLENSMSKDVFINSSTTNMFDETEKQVVFVPYASSAKHTDPSYHLPAFYQLWSLWANNQRWFWAELADKSREMFPLFAHPQTGLMPDYANFDGTPTGSSHADFRFDAWRCAMNMAVDYAWFKGSEIEVTLINRLHNFFASKGIDSYKNQYSLSGTELSGGDHSPGLVACNATGALASNQKIAWDFIDDFFTMTLTSGEYRYYDGLLYFLNYLHLSGNFKIYKPDNVLETALDEQFTYNDGYLMIDNFESKAIGDEYLMRKTDSSPASAIVVANPAVSSEKSLQILPGNYDEQFILKFKLPEGRTLKNDFTQLEFDIFYDVNGDNQNQDLKVDFDVISGTPFYKTSTGLKANHGKWEHITVPLNGVTSGNMFKLYIWVRTRNANFYIDNLKIKANYDVSTVITNSSATKLSYYLLDDMLYMNTNVDKFSVFSMSGSLLLTGTNTSTINIEQLSPGVYIMQVQREGKNHQIKFIQHF